MMGLRCTVAGISYDGAGVAKINGKAVFVPFALPGESVEIKIENERARYARAQLLEVIEPSPLRVDPPCPHYFVCGGCSYQHTNYLNQLALKKQVVTDNLSRIGKVQAQVQDTLGMASPWGYRNKVTWHLSAQQGIMGYYSHKPDKLVEIMTCPLLENGISSLSALISAHLKSIRLKSDVSLTIRQSSLDQSLIVIMNGNDKKTEQLLKEILPDGISLFNYDGNACRLIKGDPIFYHQIQDMTYRLSPLSFFQVNNSQTTKLVQLVEDLLELKGTENILDAYCGTGSISLFLARHAASLTGVESLPEAVIDARHNAAINRLHNCQFIAARCEDWIPTANQKYDIVILDPPRSGCKPEVIQAIVNMNPTQIVYVSCNPSTLARDLNLLCRSGYHPTTVQPLDMFPWTHHVECVVLMSRVYNRASVRA